MEKYIPRTLRDRKRDEFLSLEQGRMSVTAYEARFRALSKYATQLCFSPPERIRRFVKGLRSELRISALQIAATEKSFQEVVDFCDRSGRSEARRLHYNIDIKKVSKGR